MLFLIIIRLSNQFQKDKHCRYSSLSLLITPGLRANKPMLSCCQSQLNVSLFIYHNKTLSNYVIYTLGHYHIAYVALITKYCVYSKLNIICLHKYIIYIWKIQPNFGRPVISRHWAPQVMDANEKNAKYLQTKITYPIYLLYEIKILWGCNIDTFIAHTRYRLKENTLVGKLRQK